MLSLKKQTHRFRSPKHIFSDTYRHGGWGSAESLSGSGSTLLKTSTISSELASLLESMGVKSMLDIPCGDFNWMQHIELGIDRYIGADVVQELIRSNNERFRCGTREFVVLDIVRDELPAMDLVFCRDCLVHFSFRHIFRALRNLRKSRSQYLLTTTFPSRQENFDIITGDWRPLNLQRPPFNLGQPILLISEGYPDRKHPDKSLGLWLITDLDV